MATPLTANVSQVPWQIIATNNPLHPEDRVAILVVSDVISPLALLLSITCWFVMTGTPSKISGENEYTMKLSKSVVKGLSNN
jgi:hypothetical protein